MAKGESWPPALAPGILALPLSPPMSLARILLGQFSKNPLPLKLLLITFHH